MISPDRLLSKEYSFPNLQAFGIYDNRSNSTINHFVSISCRTLEHKTELQGCKIWYDKSATNISVMVLYTRVTHRTLTRARRSFRSLITA